MSDVVDAFDGFNIKKVATFLALLPDDSPDEHRAIEALRARLPGVGHNQPPPEERLAEEVREALSPWLAKRDALLAVAESVVIVDDESAGKVTSLLVQMRDAAEEIDAERTKRKRPHLEAGRFIDAQYNPVSQRISVAREAVQKALTQYDDQRKAEATALQRKALEEQRQREQEAATARKRADDAAAAGKSSSTDALAALKAEEEAEKAAKRAAAVRPEPIRSDLGQVQRRREILIEPIEGAGKDDPLRRGFGWAIKQPGGRSWLMAALTDFVRKHVTGLGVDAVEKGIKVDGFKISVVQGQANVRR